MDLGTKPSKIIRAELGDKDLIKATTNDITLVRKNMYYARKSILSKNPKEVEAIHIVLQEHHELTREKDNLVKVNDKKK